MDNPWVEIPVTVFMTLSLLLVLIKKGSLRKSRNIIRTIEPIMVLTNLPIIVITCTVAWTLVQLPVLNWGWSSAIDIGGNVSLVGLKYLWYAPIFLILLFAALPIMAHMEEEVFRRGTVDWKQGIRRSITFGLVHLLAGIPIGAALALTIAGLWFTLQYFKGGVTRSTAYHAAWNLFLVALLIVLLIAGLIMSGEWA